MLLLAADVKQYCALHNNFSRTATICRKDPPKLRFAAHPAISVDARSVMLYQLSGVAFGPRGRVLTVWRGGMTYCLAIKVSGGLVCLADGRVTAGTQVSMARKADLIGPPGSQILVMTSGLRSMRDKTFAYYKRQIAKQGGGFETMLDAVQAYCACLRAVREEDRKDLEAADLKVNLHSIIAGQLKGDLEPEIFLVYPEGNWIEVDRRTPYLSIGETSYGKPILDRALSHDTDLETAMKLAYLSFDSTRFSAADVGFPIDLMLQRAGSRTWREAQYDYDDLTTQRQWWNRELTRLAEQMPAGPWTESLLSESPAGGLTVVGDE